MVGERFRQAWNVVKAVWHTDTTPEGLDTALNDLRKNAPTPVFWLFGKTQSGKSSIVRHLTGAAEAVVGSGFRPCTTTSREYPFPTADAPVLKFLDTPGLDELGYDPAGDITAFDRLAHVMIVTVKLTDLSTGHLRDALKRIREAAQGRPVVLAVTCLHEAYPQQQHPQPYPFAGEVTAPADPRLANVQTLLAEQQKLFAGLFDVCVPIDFTHPDDGYEDPTYGSELFRTTLVGRLPDAYRESLLRTTELTTALKDLHLEHARPIILGYSSLAATAGSLPIPLVDLILLPAIQTRMVYHLGKLYGQELGAVRFLELAGSIGIGLLARTAARQAAKLIPGVGSAAGAALGAASTYALGRAFCLYYEAIHQGHVPDSDKLKSLYQEQLTQAYQLWNKPS
jgi:uncharacterized protein (DUF697 family)